MSDIKVAVEGLTSRRPVYDRAELYYDGDESEVFANRRWRKIFKGTSNDFHLNFAKTVVDTVNDRLEISAIQGTNQASTKAINKIWEQNELVLDASEIHRKALYYGECYAIVWPDEDGEVQITYNSPKTTVLVYDDENPRIKSYGAKMWETTDSFGKKFTKLNLYYADRIEKFTRQGELSTVNEQGNWSLTDTVDNPFGEVPVFHFRTHRPYGTPEHSAAMGPQDAINKLVTNHMHTVDYHGAPQRYALSNGGNTAEFDDFDDDDTARENISGLQSSPGELWYLQGVTNVGTFAAADHKVFTEPVMAYVKSMASLTQTPIHYFQGGGQYGSGEAFRTAEAPLTKKVANRQRSFGSTWRDIFRFALKIDGIKADVQVRWGNTEALDTSDTWNVATVKQNLGLPLNRILTDAGYDEELADQIVKESEALKAKKEQTELVSGQGAGMNSHNIALKAQAGN